MELAVRGHPDVVAVVVAAVKVRVDWQHYPLPLVLADFILVRIRILGLLDFVLRMRNHYRYIVIRRNKNEKANGAPEKSMKIKMTVSSKCIIFQH